MDFSLGASIYGSLSVARYLLEQGADRDKIDIEGNTPLHHAVRNGHLEITKLLMVYGADLNARNNVGQLPIDVDPDEEEVDPAVTEEIKQAIRDEPRRRMDEAPGKRATDQDLHPNISTPDYVQQEGNNPGEQTAEDQSEEGEVAEEDEPSEPSDDDEDDDH